MRLLTLLGLALATASLSGNAGAQSDTAPRRATAKPIRVVYYHPADHPPLPGYRKRLDKLMRHVQEFYANGMAQNGWGRRTFALERDANGVTIRLAPGRLKLAEHRRGETERFLHEDVEKALRAQGLDPQRETLMIFSNLLVWKEGKALEVGPFYGGGGTGGGMATAYDDPLLDPDSLGSKEPGGYYVNHPCSIGEFNSHYIGGVIHELGHGLGLPHDRENATDRAAKGQAIMGGGNHTYGREKRAGEGLGSFMTPAEAMQLAYHPLFRPEVVPTENARLTWKTLRVREEAGGFEISGVVTATPKAVGIVAFNDPPENSDYDAISAAANIAPDGSFSVRVPDATPGAYELRLMVCHETGNKSVLRAEYRVAPNGKVDAAPIISAALVSPIFQAFAQGDFPTARTLLAEWRRQAGDTEEVQRQARIIAGWMAPSAPIDLQTVAPSVRSVAVSDLRFETEKVGWGAPLRDRVLAEGNNALFLRAKEEVFAKGLFAHAPSVYALRLHGKWDKLTTGLAIQQGANGSAVFVIKGDGRELYRSPVLRAGGYERIALALRGVDRLELIVEDGGDGNGSDWGVWLNPTLQRNP